MELVVLTVQDCPNALVLEQRLAQVLAELAPSQAQVPILRRTVTDDEQAARWGMRGSPTVLVDGFDPFADPSMSASVSCRMYPGHEGRAEGAPSVQALRQALRRALG